MAAKKSRKVIVRSGFGDLLSTVKDRIQTAQTRAVSAVNSELVRLYWDIGRIIDDRQKREGWGTGVIPRLAAALESELPELRGFSKRTIDRMIAFYRAYPAPHEISPPVVAKLPNRKVPRAAAQLSLASKVPQPVAQMTPDSKGPPAVAQSSVEAFWLVPWAHHVILMEKVKDLPTRRWAVRRVMCCQHGRRSERARFQLRQELQHLPAVGTVVDKQYIVGATGSPIGCSSTSGAGEQHWQSCALVTFR